MPDQDDTAPEESTPDEPNDKPLPTNEELLDAVFGGRNSSERKKSVEEMEEEFDTPDKMLELMAAIQAVGQSTDAFGDDVLMCVTCGTDTTCQECNGKKTVEAGQYDLPCPHCGGTGSCPMNRL
jgi:hypothetical protein